MKAGEEEALGEDDEMSALLKNEREKIRELAAEPEKYDLNATEQLQVIDMIQSSARPMSYFNVARADQAARMRESMQGMSGFNDLHFLRVVGQSQLQKEIEEIRDVPKKFYDYKAIHRNEITHEIEGEEPKRKDTEAGSARGDGRSSDVGTRRSATTRERASARLTELNAK